MRIIHNLSGKRLDPTAVAALTAIYKRGEIRIQQPSSVLRAPAAELPAQPSVTPSSAPEARAAVAAAEVPDDSFRMLQQEL